LHLVGKILFFLWSALMVTGIMEHDEGGRICVIKGKEKKLWDKPRKDLQMLHIDRWKLKDSVNSKWEMLHL
jgi:hypothetical protein